VGDGEVPLAPGYPGDCADAGAGSGEALRGSGGASAGRTTATGGRGLDQGFARARSGSGRTAQGDVPPELGSGNPEASSWLTEEIAALREALAAAPDSAALVRALYALQRMDRHDALGEHTATMALLATLHRPLATGGHGLSPEAREAAEAALVAAVHDALRAGRYDSTRSLLAPFDGGAGALPEVEGSGVRTTLALAQVALDEAAGDLASAITRLDALWAEVGSEDAQLARDLAATAAMLARRLSGEGRGGYLSGPTAPATAAAVGGVPAAYALLPAYPNPFTGRTAVPFALPEAARVRVEAYDLLGRRVAVLADDVYEAGRHTAVLDGRGLASGVYVVRAVMGSPSGSPSGADASGTGRAARAFTRRVTLLK
jgi:hypothetical protein